MTNKIDPEEGMTIAEDDEDEMVDLASGEESTEEKDD